MVTVKISEDQLLDMFQDRLEKALGWWGDVSNMDLHLEMYESMIEGCCFDDAELDIMSIIDNDIVNYTSVIYSDDVDFKKLMDLYKSGECDISCEDLECGNYSYIEAVADDRILVRW